MFHLLRFGYLIVLLNCMCLISGNFTIPIDDKNVSTFSKSLQSKDWLIRGGDMADVSQFPWVVSISATRKCVGSFFSKPYYILTAASCFNFRDIDVSTVLLRWGSSRDDDGGRTSHPQHVFRHPSYSVNSGVIADHDFAVVVSRRKILETAETQMLPMAYPRMEKLINRMMDTKRECVVTGFKNNRLRSIKTNLIPFKDCQDMLLEKHPGRIITPELHVCTYTEGRSLCQDDYGSGLVCEGSSMLIAVFAFVGDCWERGRPSVYVRLEHHRSFISATVAATTRSTKNRGIHTHAPHLVLIPGVLSFGILIALKTIDSNMLLHRLVNAA